MDATKKDWRTILRAAGCTVRSSGSRNGGREWYVAFVWQGEEYDLPYEKIEDWLRYRGLYPTEDRIRITTLERDANVLKNQLEGVSAHMECLSLELAKVQAAGFDTKAIMVWRFDDAPLCFRGLSTHGGDEDWLALIPPGVDRPMWMDSGSSFGCCEVSEHKVGEYTVTIGAHG